MKLDKLEQELENCETIEEQKELYFFQHRKQMNISKFKEGDVVYVRDYDNTPTVTIIEEIHDDENGSTVLSLEDGRCYFIDSPVIFKTNKECLINCIGEMEKSLVDLKEKLKKEENNV